jgi:hypothetical protein
LAFWSTCEQGCQPLKEICGFAITRRHAAESGKIRWVTIETVRVILGIQCRKLSEIEYEVVVAEFVNRRLDGKTRKLAENVRDITL